jgi:hypothetical protein
MGHLRHVNFALRWFGYAVVPEYIGHWSIRDGKVRQDLIQIGWRLARAGKDEAPTSPFSRMLKASKR